MAVRGPAVRRMILRPEPPSSPWRGVARSTGAWKWCSKRDFRTSMDMVSASNIADFWQSEYLTDC